MQSERYNMYKPNNLDKEVRPLCVLLWHYEIDSADAIGTSLERHQCDISNSMENLNEKIQRIP